MWRKTTMSSIFLSSFYSLPSPTNLSYWWNMGSLLSMTLIIQIVSGLFLTMYYSGNVLVAFDCVNQKIGRDVSGSWVVRYVHSNGASLFLALMYFHVGRGIYYKRYYNSHTWLAGVLLMLLSMLTAFLGYVLPWGQMSFWGATVITNLLSAIPFWGVSIVKWIWGGFCVDNAALNRFYTLHFLMPFVIGALSLVHLLFLHEWGSGNPVGDFSGSLKTSFWPYFGVKDIFGAMGVVSVFLVMVFLFPDLFGDPDNYHKADPLITPVHIKPEWYFLFAYAILRCIPNKSLGVVALVASILSLALLPLGRGGFVPSLAYQTVFWVWVGNFVLLTWLGGCPVKTVYTYLAQVSSFLYFWLLFLLSIL